MPGIVTLGFVGDIMIDREVLGSLNRYGAGDYAFIFEKIRPTLEQFDWLFGNLEGPVSEKTEQCGSIYSFQMKPVVLPVLQAVGFKAFSLANNHLFDYCESAFIDTLNNFASSSLIYIGAGRTEEEAFEPKIVNIKNLKVALLGMTEFASTWMKASETKPGLAMIDETKMCQSLERVKGQADITVVSFHFGEEYKLEPNEYQKRIAEKALDCGANIVVGHHPHVSQPLVSNEKGYIAYSLGNFVFDQSFSSETMKGNILKVVIKDKKLQTVEYLPYRLNKFYQPEPFQ